MKKLSFAFCFMVVFTSINFAQGYKITEPYGSSATSGKLGAKSTQKYTYLYDTSLIQAIKLKDEQRVKMLMYAQVNPNEKNDEGFTPLYFAAQYLTPESLTLILDRGARVNLLSKYNLTPLMAAAAAGRADNVKILLEYGADPNLLDDKELTALDHAFNNHQLDAAILLSPVTTIKKATMNVEELADENMNGKAALEHSAALEENLPSENQEAAPQEQSAPVEEQAIFTIVPQVEPVYNPTLAEIDAKIAQTRQALDRLIALRAQILASEEQTLVENVVPQNKTEAKEVKTTHTKTSSSKTTSTKTTSSKFGAKK